jgi:hypothetical protein
MIDTADRPCRDYLFATHVAEEIWVSYRSIITKIFVVIHISIVPEDECFRVTHSCHIANSPLLRYLWQSLKRPNSRFRGQVSRAYFEPSFSFGGG